MREVSPRVEASIARQLQSFEGGHNVAARYLKDSRELVRRLGSGEEQHRHAGQIASGHCENAIRGAPASGQGAMEAP